MKTKSNFQAHSGTMACRWPSYVKKDGSRKRLQHTFVASGDKVVTTKRAQKAEERRAKGKSILAEMREKIKAESKAGKLARRRLQSMRENPDAKVGAIKTDKSGKPFVQPRVGGKFGKRVNLS